MRSEAAEGGGERAREEGLESQKGKERERGRVGAASRTLTNVRWDVMEFGKSEL